jgi:hypothetical protein
LLLARLGDFVITAALLTVLIVVALGQFPLPPIPDY